MADQNPKAYIVGFAFSGNDRVGVMVGGVTAPSSEAACILCLSDAMRNAQAAGTPIVEPPVSHACIELNEDFLVNALALMRGQQPGGAAVLSLASARPVPAPKTYEPCYRCQGDHHPDQCPTLGGLVPPEPPAA